MNKRLFLASILLLITVFGVATFNMRANATGEETPTPTTEPTLATTPVESTATPEVTLTPSPTEIVPTLTTSPTPTPSIAVAVEEDESEDEVQGTNATAPNVQVVNNNNNTNTNNNEQRIYLEAPQVTHITNGGSPVYEEPLYIEETPSTGPENLALLGLIPTGVIGYLIRRKRN